MNRWLPIFVPLILTAAFIFGWSFADLPDEPLGVARGRGAEGGVVLRPGESTGEGVDFLRTLRSDPPAPPGPPLPPPPPPPLPPPPPPDVAVLFKAALSAIERDEKSGAFKALVRNPAPTGPQIVAISPGDLFGNGWKISAISQDTVTLRKGRDVRVVRLYG